MHFHTTLPPSGLSLHPSKSNVYTLRCEAVGYLVETFGKEEVVKTILDRALELVQESHYYAEHVYDIYEGIGNVRLSELVELENLMRWMYGDTPGGIFLENPVWSTICGEVLMEKVDNFFEDVVSQLVEGFRITGISDDILGLLFDPVGDKYIEVAVEETISAVHRYRVQGFINNMIIIVRSDYNGRIKRQDKLRF